MTTMIKKADDLLVKTDDNAYCAQENECFERIMQHVINLYCMGDSSSLSIREVRELATSVAYVLGSIDASQVKATYIQNAKDPISLWQGGLSLLDMRVAQALDLWNEIVLTMPPIRNVALRDTLASLGKIRSQYDTRFAAHEVPCDIDYQLSKPVDQQLMGIDYIEAWLAQLLMEASWIARFDTESCIAVLERVCPDYRGLHVNLYDLLHSYEGELDMREF